MPWKPVETFLKELKSTDYYGDYNGSLGTVRTALGITTTNISVQPLSRTKNPCLTYKLTESYGVEKSWVVKFSPEGKQDDPWYDVTKEYSILVDLSLPPRTPAPTPLHCSTAAERRAVGTKFILMSYEEGKSYAVGSLIPKHKRVKAFTSVMKEIAKVHNLEWTATSGRRSPHHSSDAFWAEQITCWQNNYSEAVDKESLSQYESRSSSSSDADRLFNKLGRAQKCSDGKIGIVHGDLTVSNIIFDQHFNVKAIVDWKYHRNGDPMVDVAYFSMMFTRPESYGARFRPINRNPLLIDDESCAELSETVLREYVSHSRHPFNRSVFFYAKAVCCLRLLSILKAAAVDGFWGHESGAYQNTKGHPQLILDFLTAAGKEYFSLSLK